jgi:diacylglycerol kinase (ATP)
LEYIEPIVPVQYVYMKPLAIIYNPNSGKKRNIKGMIEHRLTQANI